MRYLVLLLLSSCAMKPVIPQPRNDAHIPRHEREYRCVERLIKIDVPPMEASLICARIYGPKESKV